MPPVKRPSQRPGRDRRSSALRSVEMFLWTAGLFLLGWVGFVWADGAIYQLRAGARLDAAADAVSQDAAVRGPAEPGASPSLEPSELPGDEGVADPDGTAEPAVSYALNDPVGRLEIPRLGLSVVVAEGATQRVLSRAVGHLPSTPLPGAAGNAALAGHRDRHFRPLREIRTGDEILFTTPSQTVHYRVEWTEVVRPDALRVLDPTDHRALTLITCYPFDFVGNAPDRFIVRAREIDAGPSPPLIGS